jgi:hypothetical protein
MIEISAIVFSLLIEAYVILLIGVGSWFYFASKKKKNDRNAALKLVEQIKQQSEARLSSTGAFLKEKYSLEGPKLKKAIALIDKSEKHFFQKVIDIYLNRDAEALSSLDAEVAALIDIYKSLTPAMPAAKNESEKDQQIELLQAANAQLTDELAITNKTMSDMIAEFGNMFGGGSDNELQQTEVVQKVIAHHQKDLNNAIDDEVEDLSSDEIDIETDDKSEEVTSEDDIDDILNGVISSDNK